MDGDIPDEAEIEDSNMSSMSKKSNKSTKSKGFAGYLEVRAHQYVKISITILFDTSKN